MMHTNEPISVGLLTHDIRYAATDLSPGEAPWSKRLPLLSSHFRYHTAHIGASFLCLQEVLHNQIEDLCSLLNHTRCEAPKPAVSSQASDVLTPAWTYIGVGRNDGKESGEYAPVFYLSHTWELLHSDTIWLSETPQRPGSKGWDAASVRICTVGLFRHRETVRDVVVLNTHIDDQGLMARREGAKLVKSQAKLWMEKGYFVMLAGDLNSTPAEEAYLVLTSEDSPLIDTRECVRVEDRYGNDITFTGFENKEEAKQRIDYLFIGSRNEIGQEMRRGCVVQYGVLPNRFDDGIYQSDHRAVVAVVNII